MKKLIIILTFLNFNNFSAAQIFELNSQGPLASEFNDSRSANWIDFNSDGHLDIYISNGKSGGQSNLLYSGDGLGNWNLVAGTPLTIDNLPSVGASWADVTGNGFPECYTTNWYGHRNLLYENRGAMGFNSIVQVDPVLQNSYSETASWGDFDQDGRLDLYVTNSANSLKNLLFTRTSSGLFSQITTGPAVNDEFASRCVNWVDYDNDGDADLFVTNENNQKNNLYRNDGAGVFTPILNGDLVNDHASSMGGTWGDYDNDGDMDVFVSNWGQNNALYRNDGNDVFTKISNTLGNDLGSSFCANWADIDNDADLDLFVGNAFDNNHPLDHFLYINNGDGTFSRNTQDTVAKILGWNYGNAFGDYDKDGDLDLLMSNCLNASEVNRVFENQSRNIGNPNSFVTIECRGVQSNRSGIGARVKVKSTINGQPLLQIREISAQTGYSGQNMLPAHFGLADAQMIDTVIISWPSGIVDTTTAIPANTYYYAVEGQGLVLTPQSIISETEAKELRVYPNPAKSRLFVDLDCENCECTFWLVDSQGKKFRCATPTKFEESKWGLELPKSIRAGLYFLLIESDEEHWSEKVIIED